MAGEEVSSVWNKLISKLKSLLLPISLLLNMITDKFNELKEKQILVFRLSEVELNEEGWGSKTTFFNGDYEVNTNSGMIIFIDRVGDRIYLIRDKDNELVKFLQSLEDYFFDKLPSTINSTSGSEQVEFEGNIFHVNIYKDELGVNKKEINKAIRNFIYSNYVVKRLQQQEESFRVEIIRKNGVVIVKGDTLKIKELLKTLGFEWDKDKKEWRKKNGNETEVIKKILENN